MGRHSEALTTTQEAVEIYRRLAVDNPAAHEPALARSLTLWAMLLANGDDLPETLSVTRLAVGCYRPHIATTPSLLLGLHQVQHLQAQVLDKLERPKEAAAVRIWLRENPLPPESHN